MSDPTATTATTATTTPNRLARLGALYDRGQITRCHNIFDIAFIIIGLPITLPVVHALRHHLH